VLNTLPVEEFLAALRAKPHGVPAQQAKTHAARRKSA